MTWLGVEPALDRLRSDARFEALLKLVNLPPAAATKTSA
jgi:hypothetical protein